jgi:hypothetical protein
MKTTRTIKIARPRSRAALGVSIFLIAAILWTAGLFGAACDKNQKMADHHDELLRQEGD